MLDKLKSLIFEEEKPVVVAPPAASSPTIPLSPVALSVPGAINTDMMSILTDAITSTKTVYTSFTETIQKISGVIADEATRYKTAVATIGTTKSDLITCIDNLKPVLELQRTQFTNNLNATLGTDIENLVMDIKELDNTIADLSAKLSIATEDKLKREATKAESDAEYAKFVSDFEITIAKITSNLDTERKKLDIYLGG